MANNKMVKIMTLHSVLCSWSHSSPNIKYHTFKSIPHILWLSKTNTIAHLPMTDEQPTDRGPSKEANMGFTCLLSTCQPTCRISIVSYNFSKNKLTNKWMCDSPCCKLNVCNKCRLLNQFNDKINTSLQAFNFRTLLNVSWKSETLAPIHVHFL